MAHICIKFLDYLDDTSIEVFAKDNIISIFTRKDRNGPIGTCIHLDKSTAIKFAKTLRTEINKIDNDGK